MPGRSIQILIILLGILACSSCQRGGSSNQQDIESTSDTLDTISQASSKTDSTGKLPVKHMPIYGDTIFVYPYGVQVWLDTISQGSWEAFLSVWVDTTDYIIDTVHSAKGNRLVIGYNHYYHVEFRKRGKYWFSINFNKKSDLAGILSDSDSWLASNLDVFHNLIYNEKFESFIVEFRITSPNQYDALYYIVFNTQGKIAHIGSANNWGGGGPDGNPFLSKNGEIYITCFEVYNFITGTSVGLPEYARMAEYRSFAASQTDFKQIHAIRNMGNNRFLCIFNREHEVPELNALILGTDTNLIRRFSYHGIIEDMDAVLLYREDNKVNELYLFDTDREVLIIILDGDSIVLKEMSLMNMQPAGERPLADSASYSLIDFGFYSNTLFYYNRSESVVYYQNENED